MVGPAAASGREQSGAGDELPAPPALTLTPPPPAPRARGAAQGAAVWAFNGVGLGLLIPNAQSLIADYFSGGVGDTRRRKRARLRTRRAPDPPATCTPQPASSPLSPSAALSRGKAFGAL